MPEPSERGFKWAFRVRVRALRGGFTKVTGVSEEIEVVDKRDGTDPFQIRKIKGVHQGGQVLLERGVVRNRDEMFRWFKDVKDGNVPYWDDVDVLNYTAPSIDIQKQDARVVTVRLFNGWPNRYELGDLDAKTSEVEVESLSVVHEGLDWINY